MTASYKQQNLKQLSSMFKDTPFRLTGESFEKLEHKKQRILLNIENREKLEQLEEFKQTAEQAAHDIRTPLQILSMALKHRFKSLSREERTLLTNITNSIKKIAQALLDFPKGETFNEKTSHRDSARVIENVDRQHILVSQVLAEIVEQKRLQYSKKGAEFEYSFDPSLRFTFIYGNHLNFERMISNIINNSVESFDDKQGIVKIGFSVEDKNVKITVEDNGKGMPPETVDKLMKGKPVSTTKAYGHGIGTQQIRDALTEFGGKQFIESTLSIGTKITLTIPKSNAPKWVMKKVYLSKRDVVVILDDDISIHQKWKEKLKRYNSIPLHFFTEAKEVMDFINSHQFKDDIRLLSDYELIGQRLNGLDVVQKCDLGKYRASLISDSYNIKEVQDKAADLNVAVLPKAFLDIVPIDLDGRIDNDMSFAKANVIMIDDNGSFANSISDALKTDGLIVDTYYDPKDLISNLSKYNISTKIITDNCFDGSINGDSLAKHLHEKGFRNVCVFSGYEREDIDSKYPLGTEFVTKAFGDIEKLIQWCKRR